MGKVRLSSLWKAFLATGDRGRKQTSPPEIALSVRGLLCLQVEPALSRSLGWDWPHYSGQITTEKDWDEQLLGSHLVGSTGWVGKLWTMTLQAQPQTSFVAYCHESVNSVGEGSLSYLLLNHQHLDRGLGHSSCSINTCSLNAWMNQWNDQVYQGELAPCQPPNHYSFSTFLPYPVGCPWLGSPKSFLSVFSLIPFFCIASLFPAPNPSLPRPAAQLAGPLTALISCLLEGLLCARHHTKYMLHTFFIPQDDTSVNKASYHPPALRSSLFPQTKGRGISLPFAHWMLNLPTVLSQPCLPQSFTRNLPASTSLHSL